MEFDGFLRMSLVQPHWDENFIRNAFTKMGENVLRVQMSTYEGRPASFCFVEFPDENSAERAMQELNGKWIPDTIPPIKFLLSWRLPGEDVMKKDYTLVVTCLSSGVDDSTLLKSFAARYPSVRHATVPLDGNGKNKGFGFVVFDKESEQKKAFKEMNGFKGIGSKAIKVKLSKIKYSSSEAETSSPLVRPMAAKPAIRSLQPQPFSTATKTQQDCNQYNMQSRQNYAVSPAASQNYGNFHNSMNPRDNSTQQQTNPWQSATMPAANTPPQLPTPSMNIQMTHLSQHVGQQQPNPWQPAMMPAACQGTAQAEQMSTPTAQLRKAPYADELQQNDDNELLESLARLKCSASPEEQEIHEEVDDFPSP